MAKKAIRPAIFAWRHTEPGLILCAVRWWGGRIFDAADRSAATESVRALTHAGVGRHVAASTTIAALP